MMKTALAALPGVMALSLCAGLAACSEDPEADEWALQEELARAEEEPPAAASECPALPDFGPDIYLQQRARANLLSMRFDLKRGGKDGPTVGFLIEPQFAPRWALGKRVFKMYVGERLSEAVLAGYAVEAMYSVGRRVDIYDCTRKKEQQIAVLHNKMLENLVSGAVCRVADNTCFSIWEVWDGQDRNLLATSKKVDVWVSKQFWIEDATGAALAHIEKVFPLFLPFDVQYRVKLQQPVLDPRVVLFMAALKADHDATPRPQTPPEAPPEAHDAPRPRQRT